MKLLIITQKIDKADPVLGFFVSWVERLAKSFEKVTVICLERGKHSLPPDIKILSLGKETERSRFHYSARFYKYIWQERQNYDLVFIHMNQEYLLLAGLWWRLSGKKIMFWRNHPRGGLLTRIAVIIAHQVFCTSPFSYTAKFKKTTLMPAGIEVGVFKPDNQVTPKLKSLLFLGRISLIKKIADFVTALIALDEQGVDFIASIIGSPTNALEEVYERELHQISKPLIKKGKLVFKSGVSHSDTPDIYRQHEIYLNLTPTGSFDKTILEAMACGTLVLVANRSLSDYLPKECLLNSTVELDEKITVLLNISVEKKEQVRKKLREVVVECHSLDALIKKIVSQSRML